MTTLEFLEEPALALAEAALVARLGLVVVALNPWSLGGLSRRWGRQARQPLLSQAREISLVFLRALVKAAVGHVLGSQGDRRSAVQRAGT